MVKLLYEAFNCALLEDGEESGWFRVTTGVNQGCTTSGFLFLLVIDYIMKRTIEREPTGIRWNFTTKLEDDFGKDLALLSSKFQDIQQKTQSLHENASGVGLKINISKSIRLNSNIKEQVKIDGKNIEDVDTFTCLGGVATSKGGCDENISNRLCKAKTQFRRLKKIWSSSCFSIQTKIESFNSLVMSVLTYGSETWKTTEGDKKKLDTLQNRCLRQLLKVRWPDKTSNEELHRRTRTTKASETIKGRKWKWIGHELRMENTRICTTALTWQPEGKGKVVRPKSTWRRTTEQERTELGLNSWASARAMARYRNRLKQCVGALCTSGYEKDRIGEVM
jgi:hypothetical protein